MLGLSYSFLKRRDTTTHPQGEGGDEELGLRDAWHTMHAQLSAERTQHRGGWRRFPLSPGRRGLRRTAPGSLLRPWASWTPVLGLLTASWRTCFGATDHTLAFKNYQKRRELSLERSLAPELRAARRKVGGGVGRISEWACHHPGTGVQILQGLRTESQCFTECNRKRRKESEKEERKESSVLWKTFPKASTPSSLEGEGLGTLLSIWAQHPLHGVGVGRHM